LAGIGILGDIHGNLPALEAVLEHAGTLDGWLCVGDIVGYGPFPNECIDRVRGLDARCVTGNHDLGSTGLLDLSFFNVFARIACEWTNAALEPEAREWLSSLPAIDRAPDRPLIVHGSVRDPVWEYVMRTSVAAYNFELFNEALCFNGHTHVPMIFAFSGGHASEVEVFDGLSLDLLDGTRYMANFGSVGQPRDLDARACYCVLYPERKVLEYHRVEYPFERTQSRMSQEGLPEPLITRLAYGR
jgi:predicted phosphodiesterase